MYMDSYLRAGQPANDFGEIHFRVTFSTLCSNFFPLNFAPTLQLLGKCWAAGTRKIISSVEAANTL